MIQLKQIFRTLLKNKSTSIINIGGYAISMAVIFILIVFIISEKNVNRLFPNIDNIYRITRNEESADVPLTFLEDANDNIPGVEKVALYMLSDALYEFDEERYNASFLATNDDFFDIFSFDFIYRTTSSTIELDNTLYLTESMSKKLFGNTNPIGQFLTVKNEQYTIAAVISDPPINSSFQFDMVTDLNKSVSYWGIGYNEEEHKMFNAALLLSDGVTPQSIISNIENMLSHWQAFKEDKLSLQPFKDVYFDTNYRDGMEHANVNMIYLLSCIAVIILFMTIFNYINLTISSVFNRLNEIGIRKATGASRMIMLRQFLTESTVTCMLAMGLAVIIAFTVVPLFSEILDKKIQLWQLIKQPVIGITCILLFPLVGIFSGVFPALKVASITPIQIIQKRNIITNRGGQLSVLAFQFFISIVLITSVFFIQKQLQFVKNKDLGFNKEMMVRVHLEGNTGDKWQVLKDKLSTNPSILSATATHGTPQAIYSSSSGTFKSSTGEEVSLQNVLHLGVDHDFLKTFDVKLIDGRNIKPTDENACLINQKFADQLGFYDYKKENIFGKTIVGIVEDFHFENLYSPIGFLCINTFGSPSTLSIKMTGSISENMQFIKNCFAEVEPGTPCNIEFYDEWIASLYNKEEKQAYAVKLFACIAIIISCLGLFGIIQQMTFRKIKEIGVRKVNGARIIQVMGMLNRYAVYCVVAACAFAIPVTYLLMNKWLAGFAYKTHLSWWVFGVAGLVALLIAILTVSWQSWLTASKNPVEALRYE